MCVVRKNVCKNIDLIFMHIQIGITYMNIYLKYACYMYTNCFH